MHNFGVLAQVLLNWESRFLCLCDFKELGVAKRSRSTTSARPKLFQASRQDDRRFSDCTVLSFKFLTMQMQPSKPGMCIEELQLAGVVRMHEHRQHLALEQARQDVDMDEEVGAGGDPSRVIEREPSTRYDHVHVWMMGERRAPGV